MHEVIRSFIRWEVYNLCRILIRRCRWIPLSDNNVTNVLFVLLAAEVTDESAEESGEEELELPIKHKPLQARHSLLCDLDDPTPKPTLTSALKRQKRDEENVEVRFTQSHSLMGFHNQ